MVVGSVNLADPRVKRTRKLIMDAFRDLVMEKGFNVVSVQDVAERATVNRTTFYAHFLDKYDLLDQSISELFRRERERRLPDGASLTRENLRVLTVTTAEFLSGFHGHCKSMDGDLDRVIEARVQRELETFLRTWFGRLDPRHGVVVVSSEITALAVSWVIFGAGIAWSRGATTLTLDEHVNQVLAVLVHGVPGLTSASTLTRHPIKPNAAPTVVASR